MHKIWFMCHKYQCVARKTKKWVTEKQLPPLSKELIAYTTDESKLWLSLSVKQHQKNPCSGSPPVYQDLSMCHDWPVKKAIVDLPISMKGNSNRTYSNSISPLWAQNKDLDSASQKSLTEVNYVCPSPFQPFNLSAFPNVSLLSMSKMATLRNTVALTHANNTSCPFKRWIVLSIR